jgi:hypothetical protein
MYWEPWKLFHHFAFIDLSDTPPLHKSAYSSSPALSASFGTRHVTKVQILVELGAFPDYQFERFWDTLYWFLMYWFSAPNSYHTYSDVYFTHTFIPNSGPYISPRVFTFPNICVSVPYLPDQYFSKWSLPVFWSVMTGYLISLFKSPLGQLVLLDHWSNSVFCSLPHYLCRNNQLWSGTFLTFLIIFCSSYTDDSVGNGEQILITLFLTYWF